MGANPARSPADINLIIKAGITVFVNLQEQTEFLPQGPLIPYDDLLPAHIRIIHLPIRDRQTVSDAKAREYCKTILSLLDDGNKIYLHCLGGKGRTGTIGAIVLGIKYGLAGPEALRRIRAAFATRRNKGTHANRVPQTQAQISQVIRMLSTAQN